jgi:hypothetical protein
MEPVGEFTPCFLRVVARFSAHADAIYFLGLDFSNPVNYTRLEKKFSDYDIKS